MTHSPSDPNHAGGGDRPRNGNPRRRIFEHVLRQVDAFPSLHTLMLDTHGLPARDADLIHVIEREVSRRWLTLSAVIESRLSRRFRGLDAPVQAALLVGAAQLLFMDRVPTHAAINESVEWVKSRMGRKPAGFVNAVLRRVSELVADSAETFDPERRDQLPLSTGGALYLCEPVLPEDRIDRIAIQTSFAVSAVRRWLLRRDQADVERWCLHSLARAPITLNAMFAHDLPEEVTELHRAPGHAIYTGPPAELGSFLAQHPDVWVQDAAASAVGDLIRDLKPGMVVDVCAGQGTKTRYLARLFPGAQIVATDVDTKRLAVLRETFDGSEQVQVIEHKELIDRCLERSDLVVLDVPCSNSGVLARRIEARYRLTPKHLNSLRDMQRQIIADSIPLLTAEGKILYATCSVEDEENEQQAQWVCKWHHKKVLREHRIEPRGLPGEPASTYQDGSYAALIGV
jgi:16S rRNA (cytosine967-C5)-methyltransferase